MLDGRKLDKISKFTMNRVLKTLHAKGLLDPQGIIYTCNDEVVIEIAADKLRHTTKEMRNVIQTAEELEDIRDILNMEVFTIARLSKVEQFYIKLVLDLENNAIVNAVFKQVPPEYFAICFKHYHGIPMDERDLKIGWNQQENRFQVADLKELQLLTVEPIDWTILTGP